MSSGPEFLFRNISKISPSRIGSFTRSSKTYTGSYVEILLFTTQKVREFFSDFRIRVNKNISNPLILISKISHFSKVEFFTRSELVGVKNLMKLHQRETSVAGILISLICSVSQSSSCVSIIATTSTISSTVNFGSKFFSRYISSMMGRCHSAWSIAVCVREIFRSFTFPSFLFGKLFNDVIGGFDFNATGLTASDKIGNVTF